MSVFSRYVGIPHVDFGRDFSGVDCWGLVRLCFRCELGIDLPGFEDSYGATTDRARIASTIAERAGRSPWQDADGTRAFDVILRQVGRYATHVGVLTGTGGVLHVHAKQRSVISPVERAFPAEAVAGIYRHEALA